MRKRSKVVVDDNYMDFIPMKNPDLVWREKKDGMVEVDMVHRGFFPKIAQIFFRRPRVSHIALDKYGTFIWQQMDGKNTVYDISLRVKERFGDEAEPLIQRLVTYFRILQENRFMVYKNRK